MITVMAAKEKVEFQNSDFRKANLFLFERTAERIPCIVGYGQGPRLVSHGKQFYRLVPIKEKEFYSLMSGAEVGSKESLEMVFPDDPFCEVPA